jgi:gamma-glutamylputrescine oxidase
MWVLRNDSNPRLHSNVNFGGAVLDSRVAPSYYRHVDGDRLLWGGPVTLGVPERERLVHMIKADIAKDYPELSKVELSYVWSGEMAYVHHKMPVIAEIAPRVWILNAFGGHGLNTTAMAGELVAKAIALGTTEWKQFAPFSRGLALPGQLGRIAAYGAYAGQRFCERLGEVL